MSGSPLNRRIARFLEGLFGRGEPQVQPRTRGNTIHVIILDGTMASLDVGNESHAGVTCKLVREMGAAVSVYYSPGIQWSEWRQLGDVIIGRGINRQIRRAYGYLASRYRPGDRIFLFGYSRGAYAVRSLAGIIDSVGLLTAENATQRNVGFAYRHYQIAQESEAARAFARVFCHERVEVEMIGAWDTVKSLGLNLPVLWRFSQPRHAFHTHLLGPSVKRGYHALARNETRLAYAPVMWESEPDWPGEELVQMWFRGTHGDIGGMLGGFEAARPLANIPLVWMLDKAEAAGLPLPASWRSRFPEDATAPSTGTFHGMGRLLIARRARRVGHDPSERVHPSVAVHRPETGWKLPFRGVRQTH
jgi:uncharacterized protein (DUF2235 family)